MPVEEATISVMDRGFLFGDSVYEVIPVFGNKLLRGEGHLTRLQNSLDRISLTANGTAPTPPSPVIIVACTGDRIIIIRTATLVHPSEGG